MRKLELREIRAGAMCVLCVAVGTMGFVIGGCSKPADAKTVDQKSIPAEPPPPDAYKTKS